MASGKGDALSSKGKTCSDVQIRLLPRSSKNQVIGWEGETCRIKVTSPPVDGKANHALVSLLSKKLGVPKSRIEIAAGKTARLKRVRIYGLSREEIYESLKGI